MKHIHNMYTNLKHVGGVYADFYRMDTPIAVVMYTAVVSLLVVLVLAVCGVFCGEEDGNQAQHLVVQQQLQHRQLQHRLLFRR